MKLENQNVKGERWLGMDRGCTHTHTKVVVVVVRVCSRLSNGWGGEGGAKLMINNSEKYFIIVSVVRGKRIGGGGVGCFSTSPRRLNSGIKLKKCTAKTNDWHKGVCVCVVIYHKSGEKKGRKGAKNSKNKIAMKKNRFCLCIQSSLSVNSKE